MNEYLHNGEPAISANAGWQEMQFLLEEHLPVKKSTGFSRQLLQYAAAVLLFILLVLTSLQLNNKFLPTNNITSNNKKVTFNDIKLNNPGPSLPLNKNNPVSNEFPAGLQGLANDHFSAVTSDEEQLLFMNQQAAGTAIVSAKSGESESVNAQMIVENIEKQALDRNPALGKKITGTVSSIPVSKPNEQMRPASLWQLNAGIGINADLHSNQTLQPYPFAEAKLNINKRIYLAAGLAAWSPVSTTTTGISKTVYLNDTINNIRLYNEKTTFSRVRYADIPVSIGVNISKNFSVQTGLQISVLLNKKTKSDLEPYDYQMNSVALPLRSPTYITAAPEQHDYDVQLRKIDYRFITGVKYQLKKTTVGLTYQHGLQTSGIGNTSKNRNQVLALNVSFQIK